MDLRILFVEDSPDDAELMLRRLRGGDLQPLYERVDSEAGLREALSSPDWQVALVDYNLPGFGGIAALRLIAALQPDLPAITVSGAISEDTAVATLTAGAVDYVLKDNLARLVPAVRRAVEGADLRREQRRAAEQARQSQFAVDHASQAIVYISEDGIVLYVNRAAERLGGVPRERAVGQAIWGWSPVVGERAAWAEMWAAAAARPVVDFETSIMRPDGERRIVLTTLERLLRDEGEFMILYARDVTEQRAAEERARETEARYERLTESLPDLIFRYELVPEPHFSYINAAAEAVTGYTAAEYYADGQLLFSSMHPDDARRIGEGIRTSTIPEGPVSWRLVAGDGSLRTMESRLAPVRDAAGRLLAVEGVTRDVTEIRRATEQLAHSRDLLDYVVSHAQSAVAIHDRELRYVYVSERFLSEHDLRLEDVIGRRDDEVFCGLSQRWRDVHRRALAGEVLAADRDADVREDGSVVWLRWECRPWSEADGSVGGIIFYSEVITDRVLAEAALRESEERFRRVSESTTDFAYSCVRRPGGAFTFDWLSGAVERITGYGDTDLLEWGCWKPLVVEEDRPVFEERVTGLAPGETGVCELRIRDRAGDVRWLAAYSEMATDADEPSVHRLYGACQDITARKRAEQELRESEERFKRFAERIPGLTTIKDADHRYLYVGAPPALVGDLGIPAWEGKTPAELWPPGEARHSEEVADLALAGQVVEEVTKWERDGSVRHLRSLHFPIPREGERPLVGGLSLDITEEYEAQAEVVRHAERLRRTVEGAVLAMSRVVETRDPYTAGHERRVAELAVALARELGLAPAALEGLRLAALIHDIGKVAVPAEILAKPGRLSAVEFNLIRQHARSGYEIIAEIEFDAPVAEIVLQHHERLDGSGYPEALAGAAILPEARLLAVADVVEAMSSHRPYRPALGMAAALAEVREGAGTRYDAEVAAACLRVVEEQGFAFTP